MNYIKFNRQGKADETVRAYEAMEKDINIPQLDEDNPESLVSEVKHLREKVDNVAAGAIAGGGTATTNTFDKQVAYSIQNKTDAFARLARGEKGARVELEFKAPAVVTTGNVSGGTAFGTNYRSGTVEIPNTNHMRDVMNVLPTGAGLDYYFMREVAGDGAPAPVSEGGLKAQFDSKLTETSVKFETIAGWELITRKALANIPGFTSLVQKIALRKLLEAEDEQILYGDGISPNLKGILTAGNFVASTATGVLVEKILTDMAVLEDTYKRQASAVLLRASDYWSFFKNKATGSGEYDLPQGVAIVGTQLYLWGVPAYKMPALKTNTGTPDTNDYIVGDFVNGADIMQQEAIRIEFFEQDNDNVRKNLVTMRIEETIALPVYGNDFFIKGTI